MLTRPSRVSPRRAIPQPALPHQFHVTASSTFLRYIFLFEYILETRFLSGSDYFGIIANMTLYILLSLACALSYHVTRFIITRESFSIIIAFEMESRWDYRTEIETYWYTLYRYDAAFDYHDDYKRDIFTTLPPISSIIYFYFLYWAYLGWRHMLAPLLRQAASVAMPYEKWLLLDALFTFCWYWITLPAQVTFSLYAISCKKKVRKRHDGLRRRLPALIPIPMRAGHFSPSRHASLMRHKLSSARYWYYWYYYL